MKTRVNGKDVQNNSWYNPHELPGEINEEPSLTVPGMAYGVQEILEKHVRGMNPNVKLPTMYDEEATLETPDLRRIIDVTEAEELLQNTEARIASKKSVKNRQPEAADFDAKIPDDQAGSA